MKNNKFLPVIALLCNLILKVSYVICVTVAALHFKDASILWFYILIIFLGMNITYEDDSEPNKNMQE